MEYYELGLLFSTRVGDVETWVVRRFGDWYLGPVLGPVFAEAVLTTWPRLHTGPSQDWTV